MAGGGTHRRVVRLMWLMRLVVRPGRLVWVVRRVWKGGGRAPGRRGAATGEAARPAATCEPRRSRWAARASGTRVPLLLGEVRVPPGGSGRSTCAGSATLSVVQVSFYALEFHVNTCDEAKVL